jgi:hypothetical protein
VTTPVQRRKKPRGTTTQPGYWAAKRALQRFGDHVIDGRSRVSRVLDEFRDELLRDLGGREAVSQQERVIVDLAVRTHLLVTSIDNYLLSLGSLVNRRKRALWPVVRERVALADSLARYMGQLGLERREKPIPDLKDYLHENYNDKSNDDATSMNADGETARPEAIDASESIELQPEEETT